MKINVIDLFAGCGGLTDGFLQTGKYKTLAAVDWEYPTVQTLKNRLKSKWNYTNFENVLYFDIQRTEELLDGYSDLKYGDSVGLNKIVGEREVDLIIGGPPCQAYSIAGRVRDKNGMKDDYRNFLFESYVKMVAHFKPKAFVFENVEGILSAKPGDISIIDRIKHSFNEIGYEITDNLREDALFDTSFYEIPQKRKRIIIFGVIKSDNSKTLINQFYSSMKNEKNTFQTNSRIAFENLPKLLPIKNLGKISHQLSQQEESLIKNHEPRFHSERDIEIFRILAHDIKSGKNKYCTSKSLIELYKEKTGKDSNFHKYNVIREDKPSNTIPAHLYKDGLRHIHPDPEQARTITVREAGRIQTFEDDFEFLGSRGDQYKMIGNAVPPKFSKLIGEIVSDIMREVK